MMAPKDAAAMTNASTQTPNPAQAGASNDNLTIPEGIFDGREYAGYVFATRHERLFFIGRLSPSQREEWLRDHPDRWQTREEFLQDRQARARTDAKPAETCSTASANEASDASDGPLLADEERQSDKPTTDTVPQTIGNLEATNPSTASAGDEIVIDGRRLLSEPRVAKMLGCSLRTLQRGRKEGKGPPSTKIGRKVYYELKDLQEWIDRRKTR
jgi:predicted DNA-binding transcriptional regulator AlpA